MGLAKLCYRRGAMLSAKTQKGETAFNIVTQNKRYDACRNWWIDVTVPGVQNVFFLTLLARATEKGRLVRLVTSTGDLMNADVHYI